MEITKFKLLTGGRDGIEVYAKEYINAGKVKFVDDVHRTRKIPLSDELVEEIQKLKYFFLNLTGHWIQPFSNYYDEVSKVLKDVDEDSKKGHMIIKSLWNRTVITGAASTSNGFVITGTIDIVEGKKIGLATPHITEDDDIGFFSSCIEVLQEIAEGISGYFKAHSISLKTAQLMLPREAKTMTPEELVELAMQKFADEGAVIFMEERPELDDGKKKEGVKVHESTKNIDGKNLPEGTEVIDLPEQEPSETHETGIDPVRQPEKVNVYGPAASDAGFPDLSREIPVEKQQGDTVSEGDLSALEHSESMGITEDVEDAKDADNIEGQEDW